MGRKKSEKPKSIATENKKITERLNRFFRTNNYLITVGLAGMMILTMCDNRSYKKQMEKQLEQSTKYLKKNIATIGFVTANGMLLTVDRKPVSYNDERIKMAIVNLVSQPFLQGAEQIKGGRMPKSAKEMVERNYLFNDLYEHYTLNKNNISMMIGAIYKTVSNLYYPEFVTVRSQNVTLFSVSPDIDNPHKKTFKAVVRYEITTKSWIVQLGKWVDQDLTYVVNFEGVINPAKYANVDNLLGFKLTKIKVPVLQKPSLNVLTH